MHQVVKAVIRKGRKVTAESCELEWAKDQSKKLLLNTTGVGKNILTSANFTNSQLL